MTKRNPFSVQRFHVGQRFDFISLMASSMPSKKRQLEGLNLSVSKRRFPDIMVLYFNDSCLDKYPHILLQTIIIPMQTFIKSVQSPNFPRFLVTSSTVNIFFKFAFKTHCVDISSMMKTNDIFSRDYQLFLGNIYLCNLSSTPAVFVFFRNICKSFSL